jgi:hypothetical protein
MRQAVQSRLASRGEVLAVRSFRAARRFSVGHGQLKERGPEERSSFRLVAGGAIGGALYWYGYCHYYVRETVFEGEQREIAITTIPPGHAVFEQKVDPRPWMSGTLGGIAFLPPGFKGESDLMYDSTVSAPYIVRPWFWKGEPSPETQDGWWYKSMVPSAYPGEMHIRVVPHIHNEQKQLAAIMSGDPEPDREIDAVLLVQSRETYKSRFDGKEHEDFAQMRYEVKTTSSTTLSKLYAAIREKGAAEDDIIVHAALVHKDVGQWVESPSYKMIVEGRPQEEVMGELNARIEGGVRRSDTYMGRKINFGGGESEDPLHVGAPDIGRILEILHLPLPKVLPALRQRDAELKLRIKRNPNAKQVEGFNEEIKEIEKQKVRAKRRAKR